MHEHPFFVLVVINLELFKFCAVNIPKFDGLAKFLILIYKEQLMY